MYARLLFLLILMATACRAPVPGDMDGTAVVAREQSNLVEATEPAPGRVTGTPTLPATDLPPATVTQLPSSTPQPSTTSSPTPPEAAAPLTFAVIGDYGTTGEGSQAVAALVDGWDPDLVLTVGDNNYPDGAAATMEGNVGEPYGRFIRDRRFFPTLGNHDVTTDLAEPYLAFFDLPGNERYYDFVRGDVHFFALNSDWREVDGIGSGSRQAAWLGEAMAASTAPWQVVYFHAPPYVSMEAKQVAAMRWPFAAWGADLVISGHAHLYERLLVDSVPYLVNGLGGGGIYAFDEEVLPQSQVRFNGDYGALLVEATADRLTARFFTRRGELIDELQLSR